MYERQTLIRRSDLKKLVRKIQGVVLVGPVIQRDPFTHDLLYQSFVKKFSTLVLQTRYMCNDVLFPKNLVTPCQKRVLFFKSLPSSIDP